MLTGRTFFSVKRKLSNPKTRLYPSVSRMKTLPSRSAPAIFPMALTKSAPRKKSGCSAGSSSGEEAQETASIAEKNNSRSPVRRIITPYFLMFHILMRKISCHRRKNKRGIEFFLHPPHAETFRFRREPSDNTDGLRRLRQEISPVCRAPSASLPKRACRPLRISSPDPDRADVRNGHRNSVRQSGKPR